MSEPIVLAVREASQVGEARRALAGLVTRLGFSADRAGVAALVVTEMASNLAKHGREGVLLLRPLECADATGVELLALDRGPGMTDISRCFRDGYSTAGTLGVGLGAISRQAAFVDVFSAPSGTALLARVWNTARQEEPSTRTMVGAVSVPMVGELVCGDAWAVVEMPGRSLILVADGLGHGPLAADASRMAVRVLREALLLRPQSGPAALLADLHVALRSTRGAAVGLADLDLASATLRYAGVGNIAACILTGADGRSLMSANGIVGGGLTHEARRTPELTYPFPKGATLIMYSDGLTSGWSLGPYPGLICRSPGLIAGVLYRDFARPRDDVTVVVVRAEEGPP